MVVADSRHYGSYSSLHFVAEGSGLMTPLLGVCEAALALHFCREVSVSEGQASEQGSLYDPIGFVW